jgi:hypothetical protein
MLLESATFICSSPKARPRSYSPVAIRYQTSRKAAEPVAHPHSVRIIGMPVMPISRSTICGRAKYWPSGAFHWQA